VVIDSDHADPGTVVRKLCEAGEYPRRLLRAGKLREYPAVSVIDEQVTDHAI
jgi:hypothetical protein